MFNFTLIAAAALIAGVAGYLIASRSARKQQDLVKQLQCELAGEKANASNLRQQMESTKAEAKEHMEAAKADFEKRLRETQTDAERRTKEMLATQEQNHQQTLLAQQKHFDEAMEKVAAQVKSATEDMLKQRQREFAESSQSNLGQIVTPLQETIEKMKQAMSDSTLKHTELTAEMKVNLENMMKHSQAAKQSADELARVFKHRSKVQGNWGERILEELLSSQGLTQGIHYERESVIRDAAGNAITTESGGNLRPDVILHMDQHREIIIDSKVSLTAFMDYINAETEAERQSYLKAHIESLQRHVKELSRKDYSSYIQAPKKKIDYVIMFVPHTGALWTALGEAPNLWRKAMEMNVFIADEQTLFAALKIIHLTWTQIAQAENHERVYALAGEMLDRVGRFLKHYGEVGRALSKAQHAYEEGEKKLTLGSQSIVRTCGKLERLGAKQSNKNPIPQLEDDYESYDGQEA